MLTTSSPDCANPVNAVVLYSTGRRLDNHYWFNKNRLLVLESGRRSLICDGPIDSIVLYDSEGRPTDEHEHVSGARRRLEEEGARSVYALERWPNKVLEFNIILLAVLPNRGFDEEVMRLHEQLQQPAVDKSWDAVFFSRHDHSSAFLKQIGAVHGGMGRMTHPAYYIIKREEGRVVSWEKTEL
jgi:hypothetical protein